jgi:hypothetical protein
MGWTSQIIQQLIIQAGAPGQGVFIYNGAPALGNLMGSWSATAGTDPFGNVYESGFQLVGLANLSNVLTVVDPSGNTLFSVDVNGNVTAGIASFDDLNVAGLNLFNDIFDPLPQGVINRGWTPTGAWPSTAIGATETALLELDQLVSAGRKVKFCVLPADYLLTTAPTAPTQYVQRMRSTSDGSTPTTSSTEVSGHSPFVQEIPTASLLNFTSPYQEFILPTPSVDTLYRFLVSSNIQSGAFKYQTILEARFEDLGQDLGQFGNNGVALGSGGSGGGGGLQTYTKTYFANASHSYYGSQASNPNGKRSDNSSMYQGAYSGGLSVDGDQYSFAMFDWATIDNDISGATINYVKLRLTNLHSWYNSGMNVILGYTTYTGTFGSTFVPGSGTHENQQHYHINEGATLTEDISSWMKTALFAGWTGFILGTSDSYTTAGDLNNYGYFFGYSATNHTNCPALTINYTK